MSGIFLIISTLLLGILAVLFIVPNLKILNFVSYDCAQSVSRINRYAAVRLLMPALVFLACSYIVQIHPKLAVPLLFPGIISILLAVAWIAAGVTRLER
jgi:hypothetical protein